MHVYKSPRPDIKVPLLDVYSFLFDRKDSHEILAKSAAIDGVTDETFSFQEYHERVDRLASGLHQLGLGAGEVLGIFSPNHIEYCVAVLAAARLGAVVTTANPTYTADELKFQLQDSGAKFLFTASEFLPTVDAAIRGTKVSDVFVFGTVSGPRTRTVRSLYRLAPPPPISIDPHSDFALVYSSGTTGRPKGTQLTHYNIVAMMTQMTDFENILPTDRFLLTLPAYHIYGLSVIMLLGLNCRVTTVYLPKFDLVNFLTAVVKYKVTLLHLVPPIIIALIKHPIVAKFDISHVRVIVSGAAPLSTEVEQAAKERLKHIIVKQGYGMTELSPTSHSNPEQRVKMGSVGQLLASQEARLVDPETGKDVPVGKEGEIWIRGPNRMKGYWNNPKATAETIDQDGWLHTGDIGKADADGYFYVTDRIKELIKYKGLQVAPAELEGILLSNPAVADAAVIPKPDADAGELPLAFVVVAPGQTASAKLAAELAAFVESKVAPHKKLRGGIEFIDAIPKAASGKILRRVLREQLKTKMAKL